MKVFHSSLDPKQTMCRETHSCLNVSIHTYQHQLRLRKITVISGITLRAHFSQSIAKFNTLPNHYKLLLLFIIYISSLPDAILHSKTLMFANDTKCFRHIKSFTDQQLLQTDLNLLSSWSAVSCLSFKSVHISFSSKLPTSYILNNCPINSPSSHKDLGVIVSGTIIMTIFSESI